MKMLPMKTMAIMTGMGVMGYMYFKKHPEKVQMMKELGKEASRMMYNKLDSE